MIAFDLDGTLVDSMTGFADIAENVIHKHFQVSLGAARVYYKTTSGLPFRFQLQKLFPGHAAIGKAEEEFETVKALEYPRRPFFKDVTSALKKLKNAGFLLSVSSNNGEDNVRQKMSGHADYFSDILGFRPGFFKGTDHFRHLAQKHALHPGEMLFVGDSLHDAKMAADNGISFVARLGTFTDQDFRALSSTMNLITNLDELCRLLEVE